MSDRKLAKQDRLSERRLGTLDNPDFIVCPHCDGYAYMDEEELQPCRFCDATGIVTEKMLDWYPDWFANE